MSNEFQFVVKFSEDEQRECRRDCERVGYSEGSILRGLLRRRLGVGIKEIRRSA
jgi:hypothetical protein